MENVKVDTIRDLDLWIHRYIFDDIILFQSLKSQPPAPVPVVVNSPTVAVSTVTSPVVGIPPGAVASPITPAVNNVEDATKQQMLQALMIHSGMNMEWSAK